jgi:NCS1 family nucleobase:cation symporter-1
MSVFAAMSIVITSATAVIYGKEEWQPMELARHFHSQWVVAIAMITVIIATLAVNIAANTVSPANDFANAFPKRISFSTGGLITGVIGILMMPWKMLENPARYLDAWLGGYGGVLGSVAGVLIVDYWVIRRAKLKLRDLYTDDGAYAYDDGWHWAAVIATITGCVVALGGHFVGAIDFLKPYSWFLGFGVSSGLYYALARRTTAV